MPDPIASADKETALAPREAPSAEPTAMGRTHAQKRAWYAERRIRKLRGTVPDIPDGVLTRTALRRLSCSVRRAGRGVQATLGDRAQVDVNAQASVNARADDHARVDGNTRVNGHTQAGEIPGEGAFK